MKKELFAVALLVLLFAASLFNIRYFDELTLCIEEELAVSRLQLASGDAPMAQAHLEKALNMWLEADGYTHIFIRHPEIDATSDAFYELAEELDGGDAESCRAAYEKLLYHLSSLRTMEHLRFGSIM